MWGQLSDDRPWFRAKTHGYGAGLPIAWQGWLVLLLYLAAMIGLATLAAGASGGALVGVIVGMGLVTALFVLIARARTEGGWRWRWGND